MSDEWKTPGWLWERVNNYFPDGVYDPCPFGGSADGLSVRWGSRCYVNPPYSNLLPWARAAVHAAEEGSAVIFLGPDRTSSRWWQLLAEHAKCVLFFSKRIAFVDAGGNEQKQNKYGSTMFLLGDSSVAWFEKEFADLGVIL